MPNDIQPHPTLSDGSAESAPPPMLLINWGYDLRIGHQLRPEFHLYLPGCYGKPQVAIHIDESLDHPDWRVVPGLVQESESQWGFDEPLQLTSQGKNCRPGVYQLQLRMVLHDEGILQRCFLGKISIVVKDPAQQQSGPTLEIEGADTAAVNFLSGDLSKFAKIHLKVGAGGVGNIQEALFPNPSAESSRSQSSSAAQPWVTHHILKPDCELQQRMPKLSTHGRRQAMDRAALVFPDGRRILLLAKSHVELGRDRVKTDIVLRLWPWASPERQELCRLISHNHLCMTLHADGLHVRDKSNFGTYVSNERLTGDYVIPANAPHRLVLGGVLGLDVTSHPDPSWHGWAPWRDLIEDQYSRLAGRSHSSLWQDAWHSAVDAVRLCRVKQSPLPKYLPQLNLRPAQLQAVQHAARSVNLTDELADREEYVLVFRAATLGGTPLDAIYLRGSGLAAAHARIFHLGGGFWLERLTPEAEICVDETPIGLFEIVPLAPTIHIAFGRTDATFCEFNQPEL